MTKAARLTLRQWGNSLAVRIPASVARAARFEVGQEVEVATHDDGVLVKSVGPRRLTLEEKLRLFDPSRHGGEVMATEAIGAEIVP